MESSRHNEVKMRIYTNMGLHDKSTYVHIILSGVLHTCHAYLTAMQSIYYIIDNLHYFACWGNNSIA